VSKQPVELVIDPAGTATCLYTEDLDLARLGEVRVRRASFCEPDEHGQWWADLSPVAGPKLGPFTRRSEALRTEVAWLRQHWLDRSPAVVPPSTNSFNI
jgi:hypothetical protein